MNTRARVKAGQQGGLLTRRDALDCGLSPSQITAALKGGDLVPVRRNVYADGEVWAALDEYRGRPRLQARAATLVLHRGWVLSHDSAAYELGLEMLRPARPHVHITRPGYTSAWTRAGVKHHYARFAPRQVLEPDGMPTLDRARTAVDVAREHGEASGVVTSDSALRRGTTRAQLLEALVPMQSWPYVVRARTAVDLADPRAENANESLGRLLVWELGVGEPDVQFPVVTPGGTFWCDLRVGNHVFEVDGRVKYLPARRGGVARGRVEDVVWEERKRERLIRAEGLGVSRIIFEDYWGSRRAEALARLGAEYAVTRDRFGPDLHPRLAEAAARARARYGWRDSADG